MERLNSPFCWSIEGEVGLGGGGGGGEEVKRGSIITRVHSLHILLVGAVALKVLTEKSTYITIKDILNPYLLSKFICRACTSPSSRAEGWNVLSCKACRSSRRMRASCAWRCCSFSNLLSAPRTSANNASDSLLTRFYNKRENVKSC